MNTILPFLQELSKHNNREWFEANRMKYDSCKKEFAHIVTTVIEKCIVFDKQLIGLESKQCVFRINKDVRFSKDKSPYKLNFGASINPGGKKSMIPGYYIHIEPGKSFLAGGCYQPPSDLLNSIRQEIDYNTSEFKNILNSKEFKSYFNNLSSEDKLKTAPKGYPKNHPEISLLQNRHFIVVHELEDKQIIKNDFSEYISNVFEAIHPLNLFLRRCMI